MGTHLSYRKTIKPKNKPAKYRLETGKHYHIYTDDDGNQKVEIHKYRKFRRVGSGETNQ